MFILITLVILAVIIYCYDYIHKIWSLIICRGLYYPVTWELELSHYEDPYEPISTMECHKAFEHCSTVSRVEWVPSWNLVGEREIQFWFGKAPVEVWALLYQISNRFQLVSRISEPSTGTIVVSGKAFNHQDFLMLFPFVWLHLFFKKRDRSTKLFQSGVRNQALAMRVAKRRQSSTLVLFFPQLGGPIPNLEVQSPTWRSNPHLFWQKTLINFNDPPPAVMSCSFFFLHKQIHPPIWFATQRVVFPPQHYGGFHRLIFWTIGPGLG